MSISSDLTGLLAPDGAAANEYRVGTITVWSLAGTNTITVGGVGTLTNIPVLNALDALNYGVGTTVLLLRVGASWVIMGSPAAPGTGASFHTASGGTAPLGNYAPAFHTASLALGHTVDLSGVPWATKASVMAVVRSNALNGSASIGYLHGTIDINGDSPHQGDNGAVGGMAGSAVAGQYAFVVATNMVSNIAITGGSLVLNAFMWTTNPSGDVTWGTAGSASQLVIDYLCTFSR